MHKVFLQIEDKKTVIDKTCYRKIKTKALGLAKKKLLFTIH